MTDARLFLRYWGKTSPDGGRIRPLACHCLDAAAVFQALLDAQPGLRRRIGELGGVEAELALPVLRFLVALHDMGKFALAFQWQVPDAARLLGLPLRKTNAPLGHVAAGAWLWEKHLRGHIRQGLPALAPLTKEWGGPLIAAVLGHHGKPSAWGNTPEHAFGKAGVVDALACAEALAACLLLDTPVPSLNVANARRLSWLFAGLVVLCDWLASDQRHFPAETMPSAVEPFELADYFARTAQPIARRAVEASGVLRPLPAQAAGFCDLFPGLPETARPRPLQAHALERAVTGEGPELHIFEDLTGNGKTEAALACAHRLMRAGLADGLYFALPTMATANAMYARLAESHGALFMPGAAASLVLAHGSRHLVRAFLDSIELERIDHGPGEDAERSEPACARWLADNRKKSLLAPCGVGTLDQALVGVLTARHQCLRLAGLARSVLVADEVHGYDPYTLRLLCGLLTFHAALGGSAVLLSATLPGHVRQQLADAWRAGRGLAPGPLPPGEFPLATRVSARGCAQFHEEVVSDRTLAVAVELVHAEGDVVRELTGAAQAGGCGCWVRNTVDDAVAGWKALRQAFARAGLDPADVVLHHARFALADRLATEERLLATFGKHGTGRAGKLVVGTQVLEQSLDVDFDLMASDLAPMEALIQRAGRCHRHCLGQRPAGYDAARLLVLGPEPVNDAPADWFAAFFPKGCYVYKLPCLLWRTARLLSAEGVIRLPGRARHLVEGCYAEGGDDPEALLARDNREWGKDRAAEALAAFNLLDVESGYGLDAAAQGWDSDMYAPTRLGEPTVQVRLVRLGQEAAVWAGDAARALDCALSEVRLAARRVGAGPHAPSAEGEAALRGLATTMQDGSQGVVLLGLTQAGDAWRGVLADATGKRLTVRYGEAGLEVEPVDAQPDIG